MEITLLQLLEGARQAKGLAVIIDVFRAFSTACYAVSRGAGPLYPVATLEEAFRMKALFPEALLMGEREERKPEGFDLGNSPWQLLQAGVSGKPLIHTTSSGTQGIASANGAGEIITGSFVNAGAIVRYITRTKPRQLSLVCMGYACAYPTDEDTLCAHYIRDRLLGIPIEWESIREQIRKGSGARFFNAASQEWAPAEDFDLCLRREQFDFILRADKTGPFMQLQKIDI